MSITETTSPPAAVPVGDAALAAVRQALVEHHEAGQRVPTWRGGKVVWVDVDENGRYVEPS